jgi:hypothetical protein
MDKMMDNVQKLNTCNNIPWSQTFKSHVPSVENLDLQKNCYTAALVTSIGSLAFKLNIWGNLFNTSEVPMESLFFYLSVNYVIFSLRPVGEKMAG